MLHTISLKAARRFQRRFLKGFTISGCGGYLGQLTSIMSSNAHFLVPEGFHTKFGSERHSSF